MKPQTILSNLWAAGICVRLASDGLNLSVPAGCLSLDQRALVLAHKPALVAFLQEAKLTTKDLIKTAMNVCDRHGDNESARTDMKRECLETPPHLHNDLLEHLQHTYPTNDPLKVKAHK